MIKLIVLDVDGCLTDGRIIYSSDGSETKNFNVKDGLAISSWIRMGNHVAIITGRNSKIVETRANELGVKYLFQAVKDKEKVLKELIDSLELKYYEVGAIGDDLNDFKMLSKVGRSFTPKDGVKEIREIVDTVLTCSGGDGAVREMIDILVDESDLREEFMAVWL
ncbi:MAG: 3-deoxy-D-manno-octulosonate 8-phosphate phosphatase [Sulfurimonas sp. RIFCSPHIGHO2_12_FULL_36_9]|uniref:KdsC family phosphatase n=1 Tax=Sulfurimonas sp. RIFCSPLOWO2_12_36_12 TaxID=1802253 RepID=UPI0008B92ECE|nr:HAD-IIIA family hydrolase [Sulfurimonas sp. RIFCSPLOWO2_12_36_12]OHD97919.1 MAG: 3-deoxy-D-manno-octulosonate 8-phosphate phosphatase [Sulfurimonas sp. RIFCSPHIGHO2_12_FULL_36_9]OHE00845.1 MAG: 3-deoxy-D-manno-octulosonate 8-phosphate phosphatase [Sulfurimonas sp. RIFCSPLOWO2_02_FULL_36_28]OHE01843.1 MAG: 3-deoxy-D-manno-octulosonate 8-phosphate phosphatase [Sulfurimonas sp. RIFCSPLOWO2_12_36_12]OHE07822.1 MAG: 3-deoxy-D-manno-octulosonate 8-phosphate phosphatase [Sulfurimonas sp. RIFCSPLOWO